ncbi:hypothetical protein FKM82_001500 [Ascaphus truei]
MQICVDSFYMLKSHFHLCFLCTCFENCCIKIILTFHHVYFLISAYKICTFYLPLCSLNYLSYPIAFCYKNNLIIHNSHLNKRTK